jgi:hypothetical protein
MLVFFHPTSIAVALAVYLSGFTGHHHQGKCQANQEKCDPKNDADFPDSICD